MNQNWYWQIMNKGWSWKFQLDFTNLGQWHKTIEVMDTIMRLKSQTYDNLKPLLVR
jgi:hypothetical protein